MTEKMIIPRLRVRKDWYQSLAPDPTDHSHPDIGVFPDAQDGTKGDTSPSLLSSSLQCNQSIEPAIGALHS